MLRISLPVEETLGFDPWSGRILRAAEQLSPCTTTPETVLLSPGAATTEPRAKPCARQQEAPPPCEAYTQLLPATGASPHIAEKTLGSPK